ncbi:MAG TPA: hypothetical protein VNX65_00665 [Patescibacteria group bacterium]|jgi:hypothetical protein|nr:hypothetical protein [Patescibacteria group bacterium]
MERLHHAPLAVKVAALALPFAFIGATASVILMTPSNLAETVTLKEYTTAPPPSGSNQPPTYSPPPTYNSPSSAQPYSPPPTQPSPPVPPTNPNPTPTTYHDNSPTPPPAQPSPTAPTPPQSSPNTEPYKVPPQAGANTQPQPLNNPPSTYPNSPGYMPPQPQNDPSGCIGRVLGIAAANQFRLGTFSPTNDQIAKVNGSGCFSAQISANSQAPNSQGRPTPATGQSPSGGSADSSKNSEQPQSFLANIAIAPPPKFQADSQAVTCAKQVLGAGFTQGTLPSPDQMVQLRTKCFPPVSVQANFVSPGGQINLAIRPSTSDSNGSGDSKGSPQDLPPEVKTCIIKAGITETDIAIIQSGKSPTAQQQRLGEACFSEFAQAKGYTLPTLTPPDPSQPFDLHSKQNECASLVAQTHGISFVQINPGIVATWSAEDIAKLRSCYGIAAAASVTTNGMVFAPTSPQVTISSSKLDCIKQTIGADKLAAIMGGTALVGDADRNTVYDKCINPTKTAANSNAPLLGILSAMPVSDIESQFIPVNNKELPAPVATNTASNSSSQSAEISIAGEINIVAGTTLPSKVDVFVKSTPKVFTVALNKVSDTKATWTLKIAQNKLELGNHKAYAVVTLANATQLRSPETNFAIATVNAAKSASSTFVIGIAIASLAALVGAGIAWQWHNRHMASHDKAQKT